MRKNLFILLIIILFSIPSYGQTNQNSVNGLKFSKAFFTSFKSDKLRDYIAIDTTIIVKEGTVWNITSAKAFFVNRNFNPYENEVSLWIGDQIIYYYKSPFTSSIWLPEGTYNLKLMSVLENKNLDFICYISGVEYYMEE